MSEVLIFGGTTEGRLLAEFCATKGIRAAVSVTTDYGAELLPRSDFIRELVGNLDSTQMSFLLKTDDFSIVIDATHPFAQKVSANLKTACYEAGWNSLAEYTKVRDFQSRLTVRILPANGAAKRCADLGFHAENVILEKGPFTVQQNIEHLKKSEAEILVTKESGEAGGFPEKAEAASLCGAELLTLRRPAEIGKPLTQIEHLLETEFK